jgi:hypothetical protein
MHDCKHNVDKKRLIGGFSILEVILVEMVFGYVSLYNATSK